MTYVYNFVICQQKTFFQIKNLKQTIFEEKNGKERKNVTTDNFSVFWKSGQQLSGIKNLETQASEVFLHNERIKSTLMLKEDLAFSKNKKGDWGIKQTKTNF